MAYSVAWNEDYPAGTTAANILHLIIRGKQTAIRERLDDIFGTSGITSIEEADPYLPALLKLGGSPTSKIVPGATSFSIRNAADDEDNLLVEDDGDVTVRKNLTLPDGQGVVSRFSAGNSGVAKTLDFDNGNTQYVVLTGDCTFTFTNMQAGAFYTLELAQDGSGNRTVTWPASVVWPSGTVPTLSAAPDRVDIISLYYNGTKVFAVFGGGNYSV